MVKNILFIVLLLLGVSGCQQGPAWSVFSLTQAELNQQLAQGSQGLQRTAQLAGLPVQLTINTLEATIAPQGKPVVQLRIQSSGQLQLSLLAMPLTLDITLSGTPYFDQQRQGVYLQQFRIEQSQLQAGRWQGKLKPFNRQLEQLLQELIAARPLYQLDPTKFSHQALLSVPLQLQLQPGLLLLSTGSAQQ